MKRSQEEAMLDVNANIEALYARLVDMEIRMQSGGRPLEWVVEETVARTKLLEEAAATLTKDVGVLDETFDVMKDKMEQLESAVDSLRGLGTDDSSSESE